MGFGTGAARESADIVLLGNDLLKFTETVQIARRTRRIIRQDLVGTLIVDGIGVGLAALGLLDPLLAAFIRVASELTFILNSAKLLLALSDQVRPLFNRPLPELHINGRGRHQFSFDTGESTISAVALSASAEALVCIQAEVREALPSVVWLAVQHGVALELNPGCVRAFSPCFSAQPE